jgi:hypothetical protein
LMSNKLKLKVRTKIPAALLGGTGIDISKIGLSYTVNLDYSGIALSDTVDPNFVQTAVWNSFTDEWSRVSLTALIAGSFSFDSVAPTTTRGDIIYRNATTNARLGAGTAGQILQTNGTTADPAWVGVDSVLPTTTRGDLIFRNATTNARLPASTSGYHLQTNGAGTDPTWVGFTQTGTGTGARTWSSKSSDVLDLRDYNGLDLTGTNDMASLVQNAVNDAASSGTVLNAPAGTIALGSQITWPAGAHILGTGQAGRELNNKFTYFYITHAGIGFKTTSQSIADSSGSSARSMRRVNFRRVQPAPGAGWTPNNNGYDVQIFGCYDTLIEDCMFLNPTQMLQIVGDTVNGYGCGRITLRNIKGQPIVKGIDATQIYDTCFWDEIHLWPFWSFDSNVTDYVYSHGTAFNFGRVDNLDLGRLFAYGYQLGLGLYQQASSGASLPGGSANYVGCCSMYTDGCATGLLAQGTGADLQFGRFVQAGMTAGSTQSFRVFGTNNRLSFGRMSAIRSNVSAVYVDTGTGNSITIGEYDSLSIDADSSGDPEFNIVGTTNKLRLLTSPVTSAASAYGGTGIIESPDWRTFSSVLSAGSGTLTSATCTMRYIRQGKKCTIQASINITTNGTAAGDLRISLPFTSGTLRASLSCFINTLGALGTAGIDPSTSLIIIKSSSNTYPGADGAVITVTGEYQVA